MNDHFGSEQSYEQQQSIAQPPPQPPEIDPPHQTQYTPPPSSGFKPPLTGYPPPPQVPAASPPYTPYIPPPLPPVSHINDSKRPKRRFRSAVKTILSTMALVRSLMVILIFFFLLAILGNMMSAPGYVTHPAGDSFSVIVIDGAIAGERGFGDYGYDHFSTVNYIKILSDDPNNKGILLYMNTPGGSVYHSDEIYLALMEYKEKTGRPVHAYMAEMCASGGYYICMAADRITANRITTTGSIGVISTILDASGLFENLGLKNIVIATGENKGTGVFGVEVTPAQTAVYQSLVDEYQELFVSLIADGRNMDIQKVNSLADGRIYTASQALEHGLIDAIGSWDKAIEEFEMQTGTTAYYPHLYTEPTFWEQIFAKWPGTQPRNEADFALSKMIDLPIGVPLAIAPELMGLTIEK